MDDNERVEEFVKYYERSLDSHLLDINIKFALKKELIILGKNLGLDHNELYEKLSKIEKRKLY